MADVRSVESLPETERIDGVLVVTPVELIAGKVISCVHRKGKPKSFADRRDLAHMLLQFPQLKQEQGAVQKRLVELGADESVLTLWRELVAEGFLPEEDEDEFS